MQINGLSLRFRKRTTTVYSNSFLAMNIGASYTTLNTVSLVSPKNTMVQSVAITNWF